MLKIWLSSKHWFWKLRALLGNIEFFLERNKYKGRVAGNKVGTDIRIFGSFTWIGVSSLFGVALSLTILIFAESFIRSNTSWLQPLSIDDKKSNVAQLTLYAQLLTAIFSIYFATIGIIISAGYTRLRRDVIHMLTNEQVGSVYSRVVVFAAMFCLSGTALPLFGVGPSMFVYTLGTFLTLLSAIALFPLGQRLFNFFDLNELVRNEIIPNIVNHINAATKPDLSINLANHHMNAAKHALEQLSYIDDRVKADMDKLKDTLPVLSWGYSDLLMHYIYKKHMIDQSSYWFPRRYKHNQWFFAGDLTTRLALQTSNQQLLVEEVTDHQWLENEIVSRLVSHVELAFNVGDFKLAWKLINRLSGRIPVYAQEFHFELGLQEIKRFKVIIERALASSEENLDEELIKLKVSIAEVWAVLGSRLCLETLRRMLTFERDLQQFFDQDEWSDNSLRQLPAFMQVELAVLIARIKFEHDVEGKRLSQPKYLQQLVVQSVLKHHSKTLPLVIDFYQSMISDFAASLDKLKMSEAATQVVLANMHNLWKLPSWLNDLEQLFGRYSGYSHYAEEHYALPKINIEEMHERIASSRDTAIEMLSSANMVKHIFDLKQDDKLPDHFGQIYFELAEACITALEKNELSKLETVLPMFLFLAFVVADSKFRDLSLAIDDKFRISLISTVINDLASVMGFAILYGSYFENESLSKVALNKFDKLIEQALDKNAPDKQAYLKRMLVLSDLHSIGVFALPRSLIRTDWKLSFEQLVRQDGFEDRMGMTLGRSHPNKIVRAFLQSHSDASHLFFASYIVPQLEGSDFKLSYQIRDLVAQLLENEEGGT